MEAPVLPLERGPTRGPSLPIELWDLIFRYLSQRALAATSLVCRDFASVIQSNHRLAGKLMKANKFATEHGPGVDVIDDGAAAVCSVTRTGYPNIFSNTAWVKYDTEHTTKTKPHHQPQPPQPFYLAHFSIDAEPSEYFSISLSAVRTAVCRVDCPLHFIISYFGDGDLHAYGSRCASYSEAKRNDARFTKGDTVSVQVGLYDSYKASQISPRPSPWARVIEVKNSRSRLYAASQVNRPRFPTYPYVIFYKNFQMVHDPIVFPDVEQWPIFVGAFLTKQGERVHLVNPPAAQGFAPLFPYPPESKSRDEHEQEYVEGLAREKRELARYEEGRGHNSDAPGEEKKEELKKKKKNKKKEGHHHHHLSLRFWRKKRADDEHV